MKGRWTREEVKRRRKVKKRRRKGKDMNRIDHCREEPKRTVEKSEKGEI